MDILIENFNNLNIDAAHSCDYECPLDFDGECPTNTCDCTYYCDSDDSDDKRY